MYQEPGSSNELAVPVHASFPEAVRTALERASRSATRLARTAFSTWRLHKGLHTCPKFANLQVDPKQKASYAGILQSPLPDSNRRPPPYHGTSPATARNPRQRIRLVWADFAPI